MDPTTRPRKAWTDPLAKKAQKPKNEQNYDNSPQHNILLLNNPLIVTSSGNKWIDESYRPIRMKIPAAMASNPIIKPSPVKLKLNNAISPDNISQMANKRKPIFRVIFMELILSFLDPCFHHNSWARQSDLLK
jgi:hypothetical protein